MKNVLLIVSESTIDDNNLELDEEVRNSINFEVSNEKWFDTEVNNCI